MIHQKKNKEDKNKKGKKIYEDTFFCIDNDVYKNKKAYEYLILFNFISILIVMYLICSIYALKSNFTFEKISDQELMKKVTLFSLLEQDSEYELEGIRENIVDFNLKNDDNDKGDNTGGNKNEKNVKVKIIKTKPKENKDNYLLKNEKIGNFFKKDIKKKIHRRVKKFKFDLKYNSADEDEFQDFYKNYRDIHDILLLFRNKNGEKFGIFSNNIIFYDKNQENKDITYCGYIYKKSKYYEMELKKFLENYGIYLKNIINYLKYEHLRIIKKSSISSFASKQLLENVDKFEIYEVKYIIN